MTSVAPTPPPAATSSAPPRRGQVALMLQEAFTPIVRLRSDRQVATEADAFRAQMKQVLAAAEHEARGMGYGGADVRYALFAVIAFLDESATASSDPIFEQWGRHPLEEEVFGGRAGGELFFQYLQQLLGRPDSEDVADVLEVYQLCLLLGFKGRYGVTHGSELQVIGSHVAQKIARVRGDAGDLSPRWRPSAALDTRRFVPTLGMVAGGAATLAALVFVICAVALASEASAARAAAAQLIR